MNKKTAKQEPAMAEGGETTGKVRGIRASSGSFKFDVEGKGGRVHTFSLDAKAAHMVALVLGAHASRKKLHITAGIAQDVTALRLGEAPKIKKQKPVTVIKTPAEAAAAPAEPAK